MEKHSRETRLEIKDVIGKKTIITGDVNTGKTALAAKLLKELMGVLKPEDITIIDFAPNRVGEIGGKIGDFIVMDGKTRYLSPTVVYTPRLTGKSAKEILRLAELNRQSMEPLLDQFIKDKTGALVLNDVTLYFHSGGFAKVVRCLEIPETFVATAYYGSRLANDLGTGISIQEKEMVDSLSAYMGQIVRL